MELKQGVRKPKTVKRLAVLSSGGDAPGMNAAIRAVVRRGIAAGVEVYGVFGGLQGLIDKNIKRLDSRSVSNVIQRGGTILHTSRSEAFRTIAGMRRAASALDTSGIGSLGAIGGNGTLCGIHEFAAHWSGKLIGVPGTIDNDIWGTERTIGFDTAVNTALDAIDKVRDTADAHERFFLVEVMGREAGFIALAVAVAGGAEAVLVPEQKADLADLGSRLADWRRKGKMSSILVVAEGNMHGGAYEIAEKLKKASTLDYRVVVLGHIQRGGVPTSNDRILATRLGAFAVDLILAGRTGVMAGEMNGALVEVPLKQAFSRKKALDEYSLALVDALGAP